MNDIELIRKELHSYKNHEKEMFFPRFFKTGKGEYGEGDLFLGITVPNTWKVAKKYKELDLSFVQKLLESKYHEERLLALMILVEKFQKTNLLEAKKEIFKFYLRNTTYINNWDLVDVSAYKIVGAYLYLGNENMQKNILSKLAYSQSLWERRIAIVATFAFIKKRIFWPTLTIAEILLTDRHDLIHKAVGWMLREVGKHNLGVEEEFLMVHYKTMPRTMLRYAIEKFTHEKREFYMRR